MKIELYPTFEEVFEDKALKGIFYPLCKVSDLGKGIANPLFFISTNGLWMDDAKKTIYNWSSFVAFEVVNGKYCFKGNLDLYKGYKLAQTIFPLLEHDFKINGIDFLNRKMKTKKYIEHIQTQLTTDLQDFDINYYIQTFYEYAINQLIYKQTGNFGAFRQIIDGWSKVGSESSPYIYEIKNDNSTGYADIKINKEYLLPEWIDLDKCQLIGFAIGYEFFTDGNDSYLIYDRDKQIAISLNHYS